MTPIAIDTPMPATTPPGMPASGEGAVFAALMAGQVANDTGPVAVAIDGNALPTARQDIAGIDAPEIIITPPDAYPDPEQVLQGALPGTKPQAGPVAPPIIITPPLPPVPQDEPPVAQQPIGPQSPALPPSPIPAADAPQLPVTGAAPKIVTTLPPQPDILVAGPVPAKSPRPPIILVAQTDTTSPADLPVLPLAKQGDPEEEPESDSKAAKKRTGTDIIPPLTVVVPPPPRPEPVRAVTSTGSILKPLQPLPVAGAAADPSPAPATATPGETARPEVAPANPAPDPKAVSFADLLGTARDTGPAEPRIVYPVRGQAPDAPAPAKLTIADLARSTAAEAVARAQSVQADQTPTSSVLPTSTRSEAPLPDTGSPVATPAPLPQITPVAPVVPVRTFAGIAAPVPTPVDTGRADWIAAMVDRIDEMKVHGAGRVAEIRLLSDALGTVDVRIEHRGEQMNVSFTADNPHARMLLADAAPKLAELIEARGLKLGHAGVDQGQSGDRRPAYETQDVPLAPRRAAADSTNSETESGADAGRIA